MEKKYRLGNQPEEYELVTIYLGWKPVAYKDFNAWLWYNEYDRFLGVGLEKRWAEKEKPVPLKLQSPDKKEITILLMHQVLVKDAFPMDFYGEERSREWSSFCIVSKEESPNEKFVIPLH